MKTLNSHNKNKLKLIYKKKLNIVYLLNINFAILQNNGITLTKQFNLFGRTIKSGLAINVRYPTDHLRKSIFIISAGFNDYINNYLQPRFCDSYKHYQPMPFIEHLRNFFKTT